MNARIQKLYEQAHIERRQEYFSSVVDPTIKSVSVTRHFNPDLFAELIVRECFYCVEIMEKIAHASNADIPPDYDRQTYLKTLEAVTGLMKAHFGVEE